MPGLVSLSLPPITDLLFDNGRKAGIMGILGLQCSWLIIFWLGLIFWKTCMYIIMTANDNSFVSYILMKINICYKYFNRVKINICYKYFNVTSILHIDTYYGNMNRIIPKSSFCRIIVLYKILEMPTTNS